MTSGKLIYLSHARPDIASSVSLVSHYMHNPLEEHLKAASRMKNVMLKALQMRTGQYHLNIKDGLLVITLKFGETWSVGGLRSNR